MTRLLVVTTVHNTLRGFLLPYAAHFRAKGWTVDALAKGATHCPACVEGFDQVFEADWSRNPLRPQGMTRMPARLRRLVEEGGYDLVHVHTPVAAFITRLALRGLRRSRGLKVVYTAHGFHFHDGQGAVANALFAGLERLAGRWTDRLVVINRTDEKEALRRGIIEAARLRYMPGIGLDLAHYRPESVSPEEVASVRAELGLAPDQPLILMVAGFQPGKRHMDLIDAFSALGDPRPHLAFAGLGPLLEPCKARCRARGLDGRVHFLGHRSDIPALLCASLVSVLPSEREGLPRSVMESMALGVPVIGADARGTRDLIAECGGRIVPVGQPTALREALQGILSDPDGARALGAEARKRMEPFHIAHLLRMHEALYDELLQDTPRPG